MGGADSRDIIDLGPGLLSRLGASIRARGAQVIRMDMHSGWIAYGIDYSKKLACNTIKNTMFLRLTHLPRSMAEGTSYRDVDCSATLELGSLRRRSDGRTISLSLIHI